MMPIIYTIKSQSCPITAGLLSEMQFLGLEDEKIFKTLLKALEKKHKFLDKKNKNRDKELKKDIENQKKLNALSEAQALDNESKSLKDKAVKLRQMI